MKGALLFAGLDADGETSVIESHATRRHTEELFARCGAEISTTERDGRYVAMVRRSEPEPFELTVPGDPSQAAFLCVGAALLPGSEVRVEHVYAGKERLGFVGVLRRMGARIEVQPIDESEIPRADLLCSGAELKATTITADEIADLIDELPGARRRGVLRHGDDGDRRRLRVARERERSDRDNDRGARGPWRAHRRATGRLRHRRRTVRTAGPCLVTR